MCKMVSAVICFPIVVIIFEIVNGKVFKIANQINNTGNIIVKENEPPLEIVKNDLQSVILEVIKQVYVFSNSSNEECRNASMVYLNALENYELWALKMMDASSKLQSGFIVGNLVEYGSYTQCVNIVKVGPDKNINGKHCMLEALPTEAFLKKILLYRGINNKSYQNVRLVFLNVTLEWSICVPDACQSSDVYEHFVYFAEQIFQGLNITLQRDIYCSTLESIDKPYSKAEKTVFGIVATLCFVVLISTIVEIYKRNSDFERGYEVMFSVISNSRWIIAKNKSASHQQMACLNGIRVMSILFIIMGHRYLMSVFYVSVNTFEFLDWLLFYSSQLIIGGTVTVDSFLLLSSCLLAYHFLLNHEKGNKFNYLKFLLHRYLRLTPSYGFVILIIVVFGHRFGAGPKWEENWRSVQKPCQDHWWSALIYVQSYINSKEVCVLQSWYLSIDTFYYVLAPLLLVPITINKRGGFFIVFVVYIASVLANFHQTYRKKWVVNALLDKQLPTSAFFTEHYTQPHIRASPYIIGLVFGCILFKYRDAKVRMPTWVVLIGWTASITLLLVVILSNRIFLDPDYTYNALESAIYMSIHRSVWVIGLAWIIWACVHGYGGPINTLLSSHIFTIFGKLTYSAFLIHMPFQIFDNGSNKLPNYFSNLTLIRKGLGDIGLSFFFGYLLTILVECPVYRLSLLLFKDKKQVLPKIIKVQNKETYR